MEGAIAPVAGTGPQLRKSSKMLEAIELTNFQAHADLKVEFGTGVTAIVGPTDSGKSAIIRALRWACLNQGKADAFIRHGTKEVTVRLRADGQVITRSRGPGGNQYCLGDEDYRAFGVTVPLPVERLLNLAEINFQAQHDGPFWLGETAGEVSRQLNAVVDLGVIDEVLARANSSLFAARTISEKAEANLTAAKAQRESLAWVKDAAVAWTAVEALQKAADAARVDVAVCDAFIEDYRFLDAAYREKLKVAKALLTVAIAGRAAAQEAKEAKEFEDITTAAKAQAADAKDKAVAARGLDGIVALGDEYDQIKDERIELLNTITIARPLARIAATRAMAAPALLVVAVAGQGAAKLGAQAQALATLIAAAKVKRVKPLPPEGLTRLDNLIAAYTSAKDEAAALQQPLSFAKRIQKEYTLAAFAAEKAACDLVEKTGGLCPVCGGVLARDECLS